MPVFVLRKRAKTPHLRPLHLGGLPSKCGRDFPCRLADDLELSDRRALAEPRAGKVVVSGGTYFLESLDGTEHVTESKRIVSTASHIGIASNNT